MLNISIISEKAKLKCRMSKRKSPRFVEAEDKGRDSDENQNHGDEIKALKKDNLAKVNC